MIVNQGEKFHLMMRRMFERQVQRHFAGEVEVADGAVVRASGFVFIFNAVRGEYERHEGIRTTIFDLSESGYIVNLLPPTVDLSKLRYDVVDDGRLAVVDGEGLVLDVNEFGSRR